MAPELALSKIGALTDEGQSVLDPMCGSGTVPLIAAQEGRQAIACDIDPLAVAMSRTACHPAWSVGLEERARALVLEAQQLDDELPTWLADSESQEFLKYWFATDQRLALMRLARVLTPLPRRSDPLRIALSRIIVTKDGGASLARDTAHSRPHRVRSNSSFDVYEAFVESAAKVERIASLASIQRRPSIRTQDARTLNFLAPRSIDLVVTSPPYLNAIDYLRGHRMSLVWFGYTVRALRHARAESIGAERRAEAAAAPLIDRAMNAVPSYRELPQREQGMVLRFVHDISRLSRSLGRVTKQGGHLVLVVADSQLRGVSISNSRICELAAAAHGFRLRSREVRPLPDQHRYLPPPKVGETTLMGRMREEIVMTMERV